MARDPTHAEQIKELLQQARKTDREDAERAERFSSLLKHPGFLDYIELLNKKCEALGMDMLLPSQGMDGMVKTEFQKGAMFGLVLARDIVSVTVMVADEARKAQSEPEDEDDK